MSAILLILRCFVCQCAPVLYALGLLILSLVLNVPAVHAGPIADRIAAFPNWETKPPIAAATGDLLYPTWFAGTWTLTSTLMEQIAPLAPEITTPGFEDNRQFLSVPISAPVRFIADNALARNRVALPFLSLPTRSLTSTRIISDRAFNGLSLAKAYLGDGVSRVWVDARDPNRQITKFRDNRKLFSSVLGRAVEQADSDHLTTTEVFDQFFQTADKPIKNQVEITTAYAHQPNGTITADQITAVYLKSPHPRAYLAGDRPVALYRYALILKK
jgi:hypothetical protein